MQESQTEQQGAELGERAGSGAPVGRWWACGGAGRGRAEREGRKQASKQAAERRGDVAVGGCGRRDGELPAPLPGARPGACEGGCGAGRRRLLRAGRRGPRPLTEGPRGLPEGSVVTEPGGGDAAGCARSPYRCAGVPSLPSGRRGLPVGKGRKPLRRGPGVWGFRPCLFRREPSAPPAFWKKEGLRMRCTMWPFINLGWPKTEVLCMVGVVWKTVETGLEKNLTKAFILLHEDGGRLVYSEDRNAAI